MYGKMYSVIQYSSSLTSEPFLYKETKKVVVLKLSGITDKDIKRRVVEENLFNYKSIKQASRMLPIILRRIVFLDYYLTDILVNGDENNSRIVALYLVMKNNLLFYDFMKEVYMNKLVKEQSSITKLDIIKFFERKREESYLVARWSPKVVRKLGQAYIKILYSGGLLNNTRECKILGIVKNSNLIIENLITSR